MPTHRHGSARFCCRRSSLLPCWPSALAASGAGSGSICGGGDGRQLAAARHLATHPVGLHREQEAGSSSVSIHQEASVPATYVGGASSAGITVPPGPMPGSGNRVLWLAAACLQGELLGVVGVLHGVDRALHPPRVVALYRHVPAPASSTAGGGSPALLCCGTSGMHRKGLHCCTATPLPHHRWLPCSALGG